MLNCSSSFSFVYYFRTADDNGRKDRKWEDLFIVGALRRDSKNQRKH